MSCKHNHREAGSTMIESLVAICLFAMAASALGSLFTTHIRAEGTNVRWTTAISLVEKEFEDLRSLSYDNIQSRTSSTTFGNVTYTVTTTVTPNQPDTNMKTITTAVTWTDNYGSQTYTGNAIYTTITH
jgi:type II secretory pathway pseudopilin PulG